MHYSRVTSHFSVLLLTITWLVAAVSLMGWGLIVARWLVPSDKLSITALRHALWIGLLVFTIGALALDIAVPLGGSIALWAVGAFVVIGLGSIGLHVITSARFGARHLPRRSWVGALVLLLLLFVYAGWALGAPSNYDTGLYHIGAINYARDFPLIPGLANLHERFGFNSSMWPLSAWLGAGVWAGQEFRIVNGLMLTLLLVDTTLRVLGRRGTVLLPGTVISVVGTVLVLGVLAQYPGRLLASSAQDTAALILGLVALAYLSDAMSQRDWSMRPEGRSAVTLSIVAATSGALMRPLAWVLVIAMVAVALVTSGIDGNLRVAWRSLRRVTVVVIIAGVVIAVRDYVMSGWLLYPAGLFGFPVDWRYPDPSTSSDRISAWARTPFQDVETTLADSSWVSGWLTRLPTDWSIPTLGALLLLALGLWWRNRRLSSTGVCRGCFWALVPVFALVVAWMITAPDPRFAWAGIVGLGLVPVGYLAQSVPLNTLLAGGAASLAALLVLAGVRGSWGEWSPLPVDPPVVETVAGSLSDGTEVRIPTPGDQCWVTYPLCRPQYESEAVELRGSSLRSGFRPTTSVS